MAESTSTTREEFMSTNQGELKPVPDLLDYLKDYAREKPEVAALWCLGVGFVLGWKLKPW